MPRRLVPVSTDKIYRFRVGLLESLSAADEKLFDCVLSMVSGCGFIASYCLLEFEPLRLESAAFGEIWVGRRAKTYGVVIPTFGAKVSR